MEKTSSLFLSLNIEGQDAPSKIELVPAGETVSGRDGRAWKNANPKQAALNSIARLPKLPIDENHATDLAAPKGGAAPALGWITALNADERGAIIADVEWTPRGREAALNKEYAFISPVKKSRMRGFVRAFCELISITRRVIEISLTKKTR